MKPKTLRFITLFFILVRASVHAVPEEPIQVPAAVIFSPEFRLGSYFDVEGIPQSLEGGCSARLLIMKVPEKGKTDAQSILLALYAHGGYVWEPASFIGRAGLMFGDPHTGSISLGTVLKKNSPEGVYSFYVQAGINITLMEIPLGKTILGLDICASYTLPPGANIQTGETLLDCIQAGIILGVRLPSPHS